MSIKSELEKFGRNYEEGECSYCPSVSADCNKCKKMIKAHQAILAEVEKMIPEEQDICYSKINMGFADSREYRQEGYNQCLSDIKAKLEKA